MVFVFGEFSHYDEQNSGMKSYELGNIMQKILIVDDSKTDRDLMAIRLRECGYHVEHVSDGKYAVQAVKSFQPDLVVLDVYMPEKEGTETLLALKALFPSLPIVGVSGEGKFFLPMLEKLGADDVVEKTVDFDSLVSSVRRILKKSRD